MHACPRHARGRPRREEPLEDGLPLVFVRKQLEDRASFLRFQNRRAHVTDRVDGCHEPGSCGGRRAPKPHGIGRQTAHPDTAARLLAVEADKNAFRNVNEVAFDPRQLDAGQHRQPQHHEVVERPEQDDDLPVPGIGELVLP